MNKTISYYCIAIIANLFKGEIPISNIYININLHRLDK
jgi:hypothetical protein